MQLIKKAAVAQGEDPKDYASHSIRRGGASHYLAAKMPYEWCRIQGRWRSDCVREYLDLIGQETRAFTLKVVSGTGLHLVDEDPGSLHQLQHPGVHL